MLKAIKDRIFSILMPVERSELPAQGRDICSKDLANCFYNLHTYSLKLEKNNNSQSIDKAKSIQLLLGNLYIVEGKTEYEKLLAMKYLVAEELKKHGSNQTALLTNRGFNLYKIASGVATFFGKPNYKFDFNGQRCYANSSTEHRLIKLYHALSVWTYCFIPGIPRMLDIGAHDPKALYKNFNDKMPYCSSNTVNELYSRGLGKGLMGEHLKI
jgi:hypothetical protein